MKKSMYLFLSLMLTSQIFAQTQTRIVGVGKNCAKLLLKKAKLSEKAYHQGKDLPSEVEEVLNLDYPFSQDLFSGSTSQFFIDAKFIMERHTFSNTKVVQVKIITVQGEDGVSYYYQVSEDKKSCTIYPNFAWIRSSNPGEEE